jgi:hypothetical protein
MSPGDTQPIDPLSREALDHDAPAALRERLVAYLDGELPPAEAERVEAQLTKDRVWEDELRGLDRAWHALDSLPRSTVSPAFTRTTVAMVAEAAERDLVEATAALPIERRRSRVLGFVLAAGAATLGFLIAFALGAASNRELLADLPVVAYAGTLEQAHDAEFLRLLVSDPRAMGVLDTLAEESSFDAARWGAISAAKPLQRRELVTELDAEQRDELSRRLASFEALTKPQQDGLRKMHAELAADPAASELRRAAVAYQSFVGMLPEGVRAGLRALPPAQRVAAVRKELPRMVGRARLDLTPAESARFREAMEAIHQSDEAKQWIANAERIFERIGRGPGGPGGPPGGPRERRAEPFRERVAAEVVRRMTERPEGMLLFASQFAEDRGFGGAGVQELRTTWRAWEQQLVDALPPRAQTLHSSAADDREATRFVRNMLRSEALGASPLNPAKEFATLPMEEQADLLLLPTSELNEELIERRARSEGGMLWFDAFRGPGGRGGPSGGRFREGGPPPGGPFGPAGRFGPPSRFGPPPPPRGPEPFDDRDGPPPQ